MSLRITQVDAFTNKPFAGNPAGVCILPRAAEPAWMLDIAREMSLAETAFLVKQRDGYDLRWFTPAVEVDLCGHATLASAHVLWEDGHPGAIPYQERPAHGRPARCVDRARFPRHPRGGDTATAGPQRRDRREGTVRRAEQVRLPGRARE